MEVSAEWSWSSLDIICGDWDDSKFISSTLLDGLLLEGCFFCFISFSFSKSLCLVRSNNIYFILNYLYCFLLVFFFFF